MLHELVRTVRKIHNAVAADNPDLDGPIYQTKDREIEWWNQRRERSGCQPRRTEYIMRKINCLSCANGVTKFRRWAKATCNLFSPSLFLLSSSWSTFQDCRSRSFRRGVPRMSCLQKARKSLHLLWSFYPYLERKYVNLVKGEAHTGIRVSTIASQHCSIVLYEFFIFLHHVAIILIMK